MQDHEEALRQLVEDLEPFMDCEIEGGSLKSLKGLADARAVLAGEPLPERPQARPH